nr:hypothetical protein [Kibdelosporangium sp. MJ126-NF4]CTQ88821.1 hypothetical protein [Kibdelosporangium sp. MJ126-NF4]
MTVIRSLVLFGLAAIAEIGGAWLVWQGLRETVVYCGSSTSSVPMCGTTPGRASASLACW